MGKKKSKKNNSKESEVLADSDVISEKPPELQEDKLKKLDKKVYEKELRRLQIELVKLQEWVKDKGLRVVAIFEGRDAAGKGGVIKRIT